MGYFLIKCILCSLADGSNTLQPQYSEIAHSTPWGFSFPTFAVLTTLKTQNQMHLFHAVFLDLTRHAAHLLQHSVSQLSLFHVPQHLTSCLEHSRRVTITVARKALSISPLVCVIEKTRNRLDIQHQGPV